MNTPTGWRMSKAVSNIAFNCKSFEWERVQVEANYSEYKTTLDGHSMCQIGQFIYIFGGKSRIMQDEYTMILLIDSLKLTSISLALCNRRNSCLISEPSIALLLMETNLLSTGDTTRSFFKIITFLTPPIGCGSLLLLLKGSSLLKDKSNLVYYIKLCLYFSEDIIALQISSISILITIFKSQTLKT